ncbi:hypothetical protein [Henriciella aquimarina]|uniref:hypothetical protein n=1 Tax=Henriciella aquimarina TaxID=545261 RepID=UPI00117AD7AE|nr:hypothetical protein [Henriciella aquimarina]
MRSIIAMAALCVVAACSTPGIDYAARLVPPNTAAVETRSVDVGRFDGPAGNWYEGRFEAMLANATFDGEPWFRIARYSDGTVPEGQRAGIYEGVIDITEYEAEEYTQTVKKCVEWDGIFDCEHREDVEEICLREEVEVAVSPRLVEYGTGEILFRATYYGHSSHESCDETYWHGRRGRRHDGHYSYGLFGGVQPPQDMVIDALADTLHQVRVDIAPRNTTLKAEFIDEAIDPVVRADPRFEQAVKAGRDTPNASCMVWRDLRVAYPDAPAVTHNLGACYESAGDYLGAHTLYAEAAEQSSAISGAGQPDKAFRKALARMSSYRSGLQLLNRLTGEEAGWEQFPDIRTSPESDGVGS